MPSDYIQRQIDRLLDQAAEALSRFEWEAVRQGAEAVLRLDPGNQDARALLVAAPGGEVADRGSGDGVAQAPPPAAPTSFANGRYTVRRFLGEGGKKRVYLAHDTKLARDVAFALIKTDGLDAEGRERITREAQAMGRLGTHPHIVAVFDTGVEGGGPGAGQPSHDREGVPAPHNALSPGTPYLVTELMAGGDIETLLEQHRGAPAPSPVVRGPGIPAGEPVFHPGLPIEDTVNLALQITQGLEFAHSKGLIHRDLKPGNVWLTAPYELAQSPESVQSVVSPGGGAVAKIGDFGLAVSLDRSRLTRAGMMVGTVAYMPPEQAMGGDVSPRSDLYSLGAMLYEMVCGRPPFVGEESVAIITQHLNTPPITPSWHRPDIPPGLEALILRLLEKDASKRPANAREVRLALEGVSSSAFRVSSASDPDSKLETRNAELSDNPLYRRTFVGREQELQQLQAAFDGAVSGQGALAMVVGEPGIGKTAVCEQLATYVAVRGGKALAGHCYEEGSLTLPYLPFVEAIRSYVLASDPDDLRKELGTGATDVARIVSEIRDRVQVEPRPPGDPEDDRWRLYQAVTSFLRSAATAHPLLIVLEDLHWADRGTLDFLVYLSRNLKGSRLLLAGTYRDVEVDRSHPLSAALAELRRTDNFVRVPLRGLTPDEVHRMLDSLSGQQTPWHLAEAVHRQTEGNPLFIQEVLRYLVEEGLLARNEAPGTRYEGGRVGPHSSSLVPHTSREAAGWVGTIPEGLRDVIGKRLSRLSPECNRLLAFASVIGRDFDLAILRRVAASTTVILREQGPGDGEGSGPKNLEGGQGPEEALLSALEEAVRVGVLEERAQPGSVQYRFAHAFFRQTLYEEMLAPRRLRLHQQVARALEAQYARRLPEHAVELAEHFSQSTDPDDLEKAVRYSEMAAGRAMAVYAYGEAANMLERAQAVLEIVDPDDLPRRCDLLLALGRALSPAGEPQRAAQEVAPRALALAEAVPDQERVSQVCDTALDALFRFGMRGTTPAFLEWAERADRNAAPGTVHRARADLAIAQVRTWERRRGEANDLNLRALELARILGDRETVHWAAFQLFGGQPWTAAGWDMLLRLALELAAEPRSGVSPLPLLEFLWHGGEVLLCMGQRDQAEKLWDEANVMANRTGDAYLIIHATAPGTLAHNLDGHLEDVVEDRIRHVELADRLGSTAFGRATQISRGIRALISLGRADKVLDLLDEANEINVGNESPASAGWEPCALAHLGRWDEARAALARDLAGGDAAQGGLGRALRLLEAALLLKDQKAVVMLAPSLSEMAMLSVERTCLTCPARLLGAAAALLEDVPQARAYYQQALKLAERVRFRPEVALTHLHLAELLLDHYPEERAEALEHLDFAIGEFQEMKMQPSLERALRHKGLLHA